MVFVLFRPMGVGQRCLHSHLFFNVPFYLHGFIFMISTMYVDYLIHIRTQISLSSLCWTFSDVIRFKKWFFWNNCQLRWRRELFDRAFVVRCWDWFSFTPSLDSWGNRSSERLRDLPKADIQLKGESVWSVGRCLGRVGQGWAPRRASASQSGGARHTCKCLQKGLFLPRNQEVPKKSR